MATGEALRYFTSNIFELDLSRVCQLPAKREDVVSCLFSSCFLSVLPWLFVYFLLFLGASSRVRAAFIFIAVPLRACD